MLLSSNLAFKPSVDILDSFTDAAPSPSMRMKLLGRSLSVYSMRPSFSHLDINFRVTADTVAVSRSNTPMTLFFLTLLLLPMCRYIISPLDLDDALCTVYNVLSLTRGDDDLSVTHALKDIFAALLVKL